MHQMTLGTSMKSLVQFWTSLETSIGAVSRIRAFSQNTPSENAANLPVTDKDWLYSGRIEFQDVSASHTAESDPVLREINLTIAPGEHVGICGRSGRYVQYIYRISKYEASKVA